MVAVNIPHTWNNKDVQKGGGKKLSHNLKAGYYRGNDSYVKVYSNCEKVVLFCNKEQIGERGKENNNIFKYNELKLQKGSKAII